MDPRVHLLTKREIELLHHVYLGRKTAEIAAIEGIAVQTVLNRLQEGRAKLGGVDRRTAALLVAETKGWTPGIKPTFRKNTLPDEVPHPSFDQVSQQERRTDRGEVTLQPEGSVFVQTFLSERPMPSPGRRNTHDLLARVSMLLLRIAVLLVATVALLWIYGRA